MPQKKSKNISQKDDIDDKKISGIYLVQPCTMRVDCFKVGMSDVNVFNRIKTAYINCVFTRVHLTNNYLELETFIKREFRKKFRLINGSEYFEGNLREALDEFDKHFYSQTIIIEERLLRKKEEPIQELISFDELPSPIISLPPPIYNVISNDTSFLPISNPSKIPPPLIISNEPIPLATVSLDIADDLIKGIYKIALKYVKDDHQKKTSKWFETKDINVINHIYAIKKITYYPIEGTNKIKILDASEDRTLIKDKYVLYNLRLKVNNFYGKKIVSLNITNI